MSSIITISQPPSDPGNRAGETSTPIVTFGPVDVTDDEGDELVYSRKTDTDITTATDVETSPTSSDAIADARLDSLKKLQGNPTPVPGESKTASPAKSEKLKTQNSWTRVGQGIPEAVIVLREERVGSVIPR